MKNQKIIAIGGGDFRQYKTLAIDQEIVRLAGKKQPHFLFIPTASNDNIAYADSITKHFSDLGCTTSVLNLVKDTPIFSDIKTRIDDADIIYVGGGNTLRMMNKWRRLGVDMLLSQARERGVVLCGVSAGSICWFNHGNSDSRKDNNPDAPYIKVTALGFINALHCPHYDTESDRKESLKQMMRNYAGVAIALEDCAALEIIGDTYRLITSQLHARGYKIYWKKDKFYEEEIEQGTQFKPLAKLLER